MIMIADYLDKLANYYFIMDWDDLNIGEKIDLIHYVLFNRSKQSKCKCYQDILLKDVILPPIKAEYLITKTPEKVTINTVLKKREQ